ncbi:hypothetical protein WICPIJ_006902 [Wickerhamomyces pijperi]|uniref:Uncharacterized protein n=1 Tax=Wickerhamomyces pijperi TaxID=599730 RepID=A0A9P8Q1I7_WICPI|nr:hypothetical protein WICPIJ_006902 [Wickerhamomyces pijperi]
MNPSSIDLVNGAPHATVETSATDINVSQGDLSENPQVENFSPPVSVSDAHSTPSVQSKLIWSNLDNLSKSVKKVEGLLWENCADLSKIAS